MPPASAMVRVVAGIVLAGTLVREAATQTPVFRSETSLVTVGVTVSGRDGTFLTDLDQSHFTVLEDGRPQTITHFASGEADVLAPPLHVGLLFDTSGSMGEDIALARSAAVRFLNTLRDARDMTLVEFDTEVHVARYGQEDFPRLVERIRSRRPGGFTAMYDALGVYLDGASGAEGRTILVLFTDGGDTRSSLRFGELMDLVKASDVTLYAVGFLEHQPRGIRGEQRQRLTQLAAETGGQAFFPLSMKEIEAAYDRVVAQIRAQYSLGYVSTNAARDGRWRRVEIRVTRPGTRDMRVQARKGYFAPYDKP